MAKLLQWRRTAAGNYETHDELWRLRPLYIGRKRVRWNIEYAGETKADSRTLEKAKLRAQEIADRGVNVATEPSELHGLIVECIARRYQVVLTVKQMERVLAHDDEAMSARDSPTLCDILEKKTAVRRVEYDGHFGPYVIFEICDEDDTPKRRADACKLIRDVAGPP